MVPVDLLNYQLLRLIGRGGMGEVYLARNKNIEQFVAVKALHPKYANNPMVRARFKQEAVTLNSLNHPNIVKFLNFVENEYGVFLIMEYVDGCTLEDFINKKNGLIVEEKAYTMFSEILSAFSYAHQRGIIHRDIKPSNIFLDKEGHVKILDFGIAQIISEANDVQQRGASMGTPAFMSPEQVYGQELDQRSDIYSLGVVFHQMLTGRAPYDSTTMSDMEIKRHVVNERLPRMKNYYPYVSDGLQQVIDKATSKNKDDRYASCDDMLKALKKILAPEKRSKTTLVLAAVIAAVIVLGGYLAWDYFRTKVDYYKDYAEVFGVAEGVGSLSGREMSHRECSYRIESSRWKVRRVTLVNSQEKPVSHTDTEYLNSRFTDVYYYYNDNGTLDYKKVYDEFGELLYKIDYDENMKVAMFKYDDEHGTAKRLKANTTKLYDVNDTEHSSITRQLLTYDADGHMTKMEYASGEDNTRVGDSENIYGQSYSYDDKGRIKEVCFLGHDGKVRGNKIGLAIKQYAYDDDDNWTEVRYLSCTRKPSHDGNNCPVVKLTYDKWGNRESERYYTADGKPSYRTDVLSCGFMYEYNDDGFRIKQVLVDDKGKPTIGKNGYAQVKLTFNEDGYKTSQEFLDINGKRVNFTSDSGDTFSAQKFTVNEKGMNLSSSIFDTNDKPIENASGVHKYVCEYDSVGNMLKMEYKGKDLKPARFMGFNSSMKMEYDDKHLCKLISFYDETGTLAYSQDGVACIQYTRDKVGNTVKCEYLDKDGKTLVNSKSGDAVTEYVYDDIGNLKSIRFLNSSLKPCMTTLGYSSKEFVYDENTNFQTEEKWFNANGSVIKTIHYTYDANGNITANWTVNANGMLEGDMIHSEYDDNNRVTKQYSTNLYGKRINRSGQLYCEIDNTYDDRGNVTEQTFLDVNGNPSHDDMKTYKRIKQYDERNNYVYEKNLGKDGKPLHGSNVNPEGKVTYDDHGNITSLICLDGYGKPYTCPYGYHKLERKYNDSNLLVSECYKDINGKLATNNSCGYAKATCAYDEKRNKTEEKYFDANANVMYYTSYSYNSKNSMTETRIYNVAGRLDDSKFGFSKVSVVYDKDEVTPVKMVYHRAGTPIAWRLYYKATGRWGDITM